jgi:hypothetical protein
MAAVDDRDSGRYHLLSAYARYWAFTVLKHDQWMIPCLPDFLVLYISVLFFSSFLKGKGMKEEKKKLRWANFSSC